MKLKPNNNMSRSRIEQETSVTFNQEEDEAIIWTASPAHLRRFARMGYPVHRNDGEGRSFKVPKTAITFRKLGQKRVISEEQRKVLSERMKSLKASKQPEKT